MVFPASKISSGRRRQRHTHTHFDSDWASTQAVVELLAEMHSKLEPGVPWLVLSDFAPVHESGETMAALRRNAGRQAFLLPRDRSCCRCVRARMIPNFSSDHAVQVLASSNHSRCALEHTGGCGPVCPLRTRAAVAEAHGRAQRGRWEAPVG